MSTWRVHLYGRFRLLSPEGEEIKLATRKIEGLLAMLALNRQAGVPKSEILDEFWPADTSSNNLRQALHHLRKAIGEKSIESRADICRLADDFAIQTDHTKPSFRDSEAFMPTQLGEWFERQRVEFAAEEPGPTQTEAVNSILVTLEWLSANDSNSFFSVMEAAPALVRGVPHARLSQLAQTVECRTDRHRTWAFYWQGTAENDLRTCAHVLRKGLEISQSIDEVPLQSEICLELGKVYTRLGRTREALAISDIAGNLAERSATKTVRANYYRLAGTIRVHWGDYATGLKLLERAEGLIDDPLETAIAKSARAFFSASVGLDEVAGRLVAEARRLANGLDHDRILRPAELAEVIVAARAGNRDIAIEKLVATSARGARTTSQIVVYANELLAKLFYQEGDPGLAQERLETARKGRIGSNMVMTRLEAHRISRRQA